MTTTLDEMLNPAPVDAHDPVGYFDMDNTLFDYEGQMRRDMEKLLAFCETLPDNLWDESMPYLKARMDLIKSVPGWWRNLPKFQLGWDVYEVAKALGFDINILTKGPKSKPHAWAEKVECITKHFGCDISIDIVGSTKKRAWGLFLVDDYPEYVKGWLQHRPRGLVVMPAQPYNLQFKHPNLIRYDGSNIEEVRKALTAVRLRRPGQHWKEVA